MRVRAWYCSQARVHTAPADGPRSIDFARAMGARVDAQRSQVRAVDRSRARTAALGQPRALRPFRLVLRRTESPRSGGTGVAGRTARCVRRAGPLRALTLLADSPRPAFTTRAIWARARAQVPARARGRSRAPSRVLRPSKPFLRRTEALARRPAVRRKSARGFGGQSRIALTRPIAGARRPFIVLRRTAPFWCGTERYTGVAR